MAKPGRLVLEEKVPFSKSLLWQAQRQYFEREGVNAWSGAVPFYITSNPFIANAYANVLLRWVQDLIRHHKADPKAPFYMFELGTGSGRFSYMTMLRMFELQKELGIDANIVYVMTDFTEANLSFWQQHEKLQPYVKSGQLDYAVYDMDQHDSITLINSGVTLDKGSCKNPIALIGNYIFDTVSQDIFRVKDGKLHESLLTLDAATENVIAGMPIKLEGLGSEFSHKKIEGKYYDDPILDKIIQGHAGFIDNTSFLFPTGGFKSLEMFRNLSSGKMICISTDKGYVYPHEMQGRDDPRLVFHGSFSMSVNFHAIGEYFKAHKGDAVYQETRDSIKTCVFTMGYDMASLPETKLAAKQYAVEYGPGDYFSLHRNLRETREQDITMTTMLAHMHMCHWDPYVLSCFISRIMAELPGANKSIIKGFAQCGPKLEANVFMMPGVDDYYFNIGILYHTAEEYEKAINVYLKSIKTHGEKFATYYNVGLCYYMARDLHSAIQYFELAKQFDDEGRAQEWIEKTKSEL